MFLVGSSAELAVGVELVRHEDEVPELEEALAARAPGQAVVVAAAGLLAPVPVHLGVRPARPGAADRPEVLGRRQRHDPLRRHSDPLPVPDRLFVGTEPQTRIAGVDAHPDAVPVELQPLLDELGRVGDRALLEVLAEREVAEHLEEGEMERVEPDLVDVGRAEALLADRRQRRRRLLAAEEERHLRLHAGARVERRAVVGPWNQRRRRTAQMVLLLEERLESLPQLGRRAHGGHSRSAAGGGPPGRALHSRSAARRSDAGCSAAPQTPLPRREGHAVRARRARRGRSGHLVRTTGRGEATAPSRRESAADEGADHQDGPTLHRPAEAAAPALRDAAARGSTRPRQGAGRDPRRRRTQGVSSGPSARTRDERSRR